MSELMSMPGEPGQCQIDHHKILFVIFSFCSGEPISTRGFMEVNPGGVVMMNPSLSNLCGYLFIHTLLVAWMS